MKKSSKVSSKETKTGKRKEKKSKEPKNKRRKIESPKIKKITKKIIKDNEFLKMRLPEIKLENKENKDNEEKNEENENEMIKEVMENEGNEFHGEFDQKIFHCNYPVVNLVFDFHCVLMLLASGNFSFVFVELRKLVQNVFGIGIPGFPSRSYFGFEFERLRELLKINDIAFAEFLGILVRIMNFEIMFSVLRKEKKHFLKLKTNFIFFLSSLSEKEFFSFDFSRIPNFCICPTLEIFRNELDEMIENFYKFERFMPEALLVGKERISTHVSLSFSINELLLSQETVLSLLDCCIHYVLLYESFFFLIEKNSWKCEKILIQNNIFLRESIGKNAFYVNNFICLPDFEFRRIFFLSFDGRIEKIDINFPLEINKMVSFSTKRVIGEKEENFGMGLSRIGRMWRNIFRRMIAY